MHIPSLEYYPLMEDVERKGGFISPNDLGTIVNFWILFSGSPGLRLCNMIISGVGPCPGVPGARGAVIHDTRIG